MKNTMHIDDTETWLGFDADAIKIALSMCLFFLVVGALFGLYFWYQSQPLSIPKTMSPCQAKILADNLKSNILTTRNDYAQITAKCADEAKIKANDAEQVAAHLEKQRLIDQQRKAFQTQTNPGHAGQGK